jgi:hypothetical protein
MPVSQACLTAGRLRVGVSMCGNTDSNIDVSDLTTVFLTQISRLIDRGPVANGGSVVRGEWDREEAR